MVVRYVLPPGEKKQGYGQGITADEESKSSREDTLTQHLRTKIGRDGETFKMDL